MSKSSKKKYKSITADQAQMMYENNIRFQYWDISREELGLWACEHPNTPGPGDSTYGPSLEERRRVGDKRKYRFWVEVE